MTRQSESVAWESWVPVGSPGRSPRICTDCPAPGYASVASRSRQNREEFRATLRSGRDVLLARGDALRRRNRRRIRCHTAPPARSGHHRVPREHASRCSVRSRSRSMPTRRRQWYRRPAITGSSAWKPCGPGGYRRFGEWSILWPADRSVGCTPCWRTSPTGSLSTHPAVCSIRYREAGPSSTGGCTKFHRIAAPGRADCSVELRRNWADRGG